MLAVLLLLTPLVLALTAYGIRRRHQARTAFLGNDETSAQDAARDRRRWTKAGALATAVALLVVAVMGPRWGDSVEDAPRTGRDIIFLLDISRSMLAEDAVPSRLEAAKAAIAGMVEAIKETGGHRLGLVTFAGRATQHSPVTLDYAFFLDRLDGVRGGAAPRRGSLIGNAIGKVLRELEPGTSPYTDVILISDGEDHGGTTLSAAREAARLGVTLYPVGIGNPLIGAGIPLTSATGERAPLMHNGEAVVTKLREPLLRQIAGISGGVYVAARTAPADLGKLYRDAISVKRGRELEGLAQTSAGELFRWLALAALLLLALEMLLGEQPRPAALAGSRHLLTSAAAVLLLFGLTGFADSDSPYDAVAQGNALYAEERYEEAAALYAAARAKLPGEPLVAFNIGAARLQAGDPKAAEAALSDAFNTDDTRLAALAYYNLGNARYVQALDVRETSVEDAVGFIEQAIESYRAALSLQPEMEDAMYNLELAYRLLDELSEERGQSGSPQAQESPQVAGKPGEATGASGNQPGPGAQPVTDQSAQNQAGEASDAAPKGLLNEDNASSGSPGAGARFTMTREEAEDLIDLVQSKTREAEGQRQEWRDARLRDPNVKRPW
ncbi:MAG: VWA domain-containing protein [Alphaproteobacteria bacterium]|nr:VWA domain-containing protein [Alphaproteobacteria bacterium]